MPENNEINELRYYLEIMKGAMSAPTIDVATVDASLLDDPNVFADGIIKPGEAAEHIEPLKPTYLVTAVKLPTGAIELAINNTGIPEKIDYILEAYDENMRLKSNPEVVMQQLMVV